jgi:hypothetical protein
MRTGDNIYWLFSTSLEVIATFVGLLAAGFFFFHSRIDGELEKDETLLEIYAEIKRQIYQRFKALFILTGLSITLGLLIIYLNAALSGTGWQVFVLMVGFLNIFTIVWAAWFFIFIIDPDIITHTADRLVKENSEIFNKQKDKNISKLEFNDKFEELNTILRSLAGKVIRGKTSQYPASFAEIVRELSLRGIISQSQTKDLNQISKARNISSHSPVNYIESDLGHSADKLNQELHQINDQESSNR